MGHSPNCKLHQKKTLQIYTFQIQLVVIKLIDRGTSVRAWEVTECNKGIHKQAGLICEATRREGLETEEDELREAQTNGGGVWHEVRLDHCWNKLRCFWGVIYFDYLCW